jgi:hypothetical protein
MAPMLDSRLRENKCDPEGYHRQGVGARPAMAEVGEVATGDTAGKVDAELEREDQNILLLLLLRLCVRI